ncbi:MAG: glycerophosphodiester phosphodiesterase [Alphaproteobacteria bacterium]
MSVPRIIAHRGASHAHPDNSRAAFDAAVAEGADGVECDVQLSVDGALVVRHDLALDGRLVAELEAADILRLAPDTMLFPDLVAWQRRTGMGMLVEIKDRAAVPALAVALPRDTGPEVVVAGFDMVAVTRFKQARPDIVTSLMVGSVLPVDAMVALARQAGVGGIHPCWEARAPHASTLLTRTDVKRLHDAGLAVTFWHEEREDELRALVALAPDAICTDTPARLRRILDP